MSGYKVSIDDRESLTLRRHVSVDWRYLEALYRLRSKREGLGEPGEPWGREITDSIEDRLRELLELCVGKEYGMTWNDYSIYGLQYIWSPSSHRKSHVLQSETIRVRISKIWPSQIHTAASLHANVYNVTGLLMAIAKITCIPVREAEKWHQWCTSTDNSSSPNCCEGYPCHSEGTWSYQWTPGWRREKNPKFTSLFLHWNLGSTWCFQARPFHLATGCNWYDVTPPVNPAGHQHVKKPTKIGISTRT